MSSATTVPVEQRLRNSVNAIFVTCGNLLTYLYSNTSYKAVPNPPAQIQTSINEEISKFQGILDAIEVNIQLSRKHFIKKKEEKEKSLRAQKEQLAANNPQGLNDSSDIDIKAENENDTKNNEFGGDGIETATNEDGTGGDASNVNDNDVLNDLMDDNNGFGDMSGMVDGFDDFNNLLNVGSVDELEGKVNPGGGNGDDLLDGHMGGLFGADFDFMMPTDDGSM